ncbi:MAG: hypothetical protein KA538_09900 [Azonexus sp.]|nr:hypothetical protein [Azonexus sp.]
MAETLSSALRRYGIGTHPLEWRIPPIETYPRVVAFAQTLAGKLVLFALAAVLLRFLADGPWIPVTIAAAAVSYAGRHRHFAALLATGALLGLAPDWFEYRAVYQIAEQQGLIDSLRLGYVRAGTLLACVPLTVAVLWLARRYRDHPLGQRPVLIQHLVFIGLVWLAVSQLLQGMALLLLWSLIAVFAAYFWFLAYALIGARHREPPSILLQLATFHPFFGSTATPMAKGATNWRSVEAGTDEELAVTQLKGLKLLAWAFFLKAVLWAFRKVVYGKLGVTPLIVAFERFVSDGMAPGAMGSLSIVANFFEQILILAVWGHAIVATGRLAGFRLLRNTWRPLASRTLAEFWNRYFYYFKEIMVHVYFYPTYVRFFKRSPRLRVAFATFMAAGVGNWLFHFMLENYRVAQDGFEVSLAHMQTYAFYCLLLVGGIVFSQLRGWRPDPNAGWLRNRFIPSLSVALFYCLLSFFDGPQRHVALEDHFAFLFKVLGV